MAREKDEAKRAAILSQAKRLFAARGFDRTSVADLARETGLPVGSIYTYFDTKEEIARQVIEEGWQLFSGELAAGLAAAPDATARMSLLIHRYLPALFEDVDLIAIILSEAWREAGIQAKLEELATLVGSLVVEVAESRGMKLDFPPRQAMAALALFFLGSLDAVRIARSAALSYDSRDVIEFIARTVESVFGIRLEPPAAEG